MHERDSVWGTEGRREP